MLKIRVNYWHKTWAICCYLGKPFKSDLCNNCKSNKRRKIYTCAGTEKAFHFHSFLIDMFFSLSFCITWLKKRKGTVLIDRKQTVARGRDQTLAQTFATAISKSSWVTWTRLSLRAYIPASVHTPWETHQAFQVSICMYVWNNVEYAGDSHLNLSTRSSRHQLSNLPQINATSQVHLPGVDLQNVQTGLFTQTEICLDYFKQMQMDIYICCKRFTSSFGGGNSIFLSILPGLSKAESKMSIRFVAIMTWIRKSLGWTEMNKINVALNVLKREERKHCFGKW